MQSTKVKIAWLKPHPNQQLFPPHNELEIDELAASIEADGLQQPIFCKPDGTIVCGHGRVRAVKSLGETEIDAWVYEADELDEHQMAIEHVVDNLNRRQCDELTIVRCYLAIEDQYVDEDGESGDMRDIIARRLNLRVSGRTLSRLIQLTHLPIDIQHMISAKRLKKSHGERLLGLSEKQQQSAFDRIRSGESARQVLDDYSNEVASGSSEIAKSGEKLLNTVQRSVSELKSRLPELDTVQPQRGDAVQILDDAIELFTAWRDRKSRLRATSASEIRDSISS